MSGCTVQRLEAPGLTFLKVSGTVDETFSASQLSQQIRADTILHLGKVNRFSSFGVREWVRLMKDLQGRVKNCILVECSPAVVNQLNVVVDFAAGAHVKSVQLPYACQNCELEKPVVVDVDVQREELLAGKLPEVPCPQCQRLMVFDDIPSSYLAFLRDAAAPDPGSPMAAFISSFEQAAPSLENASVPAPAPAPAVPAPPVQATPPPGPAPGMSPAARYAAIAAVVLVVAGGGYVLMGRTAPPPPPPPKPVVEAPPAPPPKRDLNSAELLAFPNLLGNERWTEAETKLEALKPELTDTAYEGVVGTIKERRNTAFENHMAAAAIAIKENKPAVAEQELDAAIRAGGESDRTLFQKVVLARKAGKCPTVSTTADAMAAQYPTSSFLKAAQDAKKACLAAPVIGPIELKRAMASVKSDIESCLKASHSGDQAPSIDMVWTVTQNGGVNQVSCALSQTNSPLCQCLSELVGRLRFSAKEGTPVRRVSYTFTPG
ncbi:MAG TPA: hypothetical protein VND93_01785 [Myxococcales bacterium]|nr:hypothetical protein [Myxococcales bacterium]